MPIAQNGYTYTGKDAEDIILVPIVESKKIQELHRVLTGVKAKMKSTYLGALEKITKLDTGCGQGASEVSIPSWQKTWEPAPLKIWLKECYKNVLEQIYAWGLKNGIGRADLTDTEYLEMIIQRIREAMPVDAFRIAWFAAKDMANISGGGILKNGVAVADYNQIDGFFDKIFTLIAANPSHRVTIAENALTTASAQMELAADTAFKTYRKLVRNANIDSRLSGAADRVIYSTQSLFFNYLDYMTDKFPNINLAYERLESGFDTVRIDGVRIISIPEWDRIIKSDFSNGTKYDLPHRAVLSTMENLQFGVDDENALDDLKVFFDPVEEYNHIKGGYMADVQIPLDYLVAAAY